MDRIGWIGLEWSILQNDVTEWVTDWVSEKWLLERLSPLKKGRWKSTYTKLWLSPSNLLSNIRLCHHLISTKQSSWAFLLIHTYTRSLKRLYLLLEVIKAINIKKIVFKATVLKITILLLKPWIVLLILRVRGSSIIYDSFSSKTSHKTM